MRSIGDCYDNGQIESFWARMPVELLNRKRWNTRLEFAVFEYVKIFQSWQRRHSSLGMLSPIEYERRHDAEARDPLGAFACRSKTQDGRGRSVEGSGDLAV